MNHRNQSQVRLPILILCLAFAGLIGCRKVTKENYDKLKMGMDYTEVIQLLGDPEKCDTVVAVKSCTWGNDPKTITIRLVADKVVLFENQGL